MKKVLAVVFGLLVFVVIAFGVGGCGSYNRLVGRKQAVDSQWAQVEAQYQRRLDLVPNLVKTVEGAATFERSVLKEVIRDLDRFGHDCPDLVAWMTDVFEHRIVDMHDWAKYDFYHPGMRGRNSIKVVLDALWKSDPVMREQFRVGVWPVSPRNVF